jgi:hypothetical protein
MFRADFTRDWMGYPSSRFKGAHCIVLGPEDSIDFRDSFKWCGHVQLDYRNGDISLFAVR